MAATDLDHLLERMPAIAQEVQRFSSEVIQAQVFQALIDAFRSGEQVAAPAGRDVGSKTQDVDPKAHEGGAGAAKKSTPAKKASTPRKSAGSKSKQSFTMDKELDLMKGGVPGFRDFAEEKKPSNAPEKVLVSVYWLTRVMTGDQPATLDRVYTCFKHMEWPIPADLANTSQQAGAKGWLDSKKRDDLKVVIGGENWIEHNMPAAPKT